MTDYVNDYLAATPGPVRPHMVCKDGTAFSVQASSSHYCSPRDNIGPYSSVEVVKVSSRVKVKGWDEPSEPFCGGLWGFLSVDKVNAEISRRGGLRCSTN